MRTIRNLLFSQTVQAERINNLGAPLLGLAKSIYYRSFDKKKLERPVFATRITATKARVCRQFSVIKLVKKSKLYVNSTH